MVAPATCNCLMNGRPKTPKTVPPEKCDVHKLPGAMPTCPACGTTMVVCEHGYSTIPSHLDCPKCHVGMIIVPEGMGA